MRGAGSGGERHACSQGAFSLADRAVQPDYAPGDRTPTASPVCTKMSGLLEHLCSWEKDDLGEAGSGQNAWRLALGDLQREVGRRSPEQTVAWFAGRLGSGDGFRAFPGTLLPTVIRAVTQTL